MTKRTDKYLWCVGSKPPPIDPHSQVKHQIVQRYLERYVQVLMSNYVIDKLTLSIIDGFAGGGEYSSDNGSEFYEGSPLIALRTIQEQEALLNVGRIKQRRIDAKYYFVEKLKPNFDYLRYLLEARLPPERIGKDVLLFKNAFQNVADNLIRDIRQRAGGERAIFLLDQYSYDQVPTSLLKKIFTEVKGAEVILTFNVDSLITFLSDSKISRQKLDEMGLSQYINWDTLQALKNQGSKVWKAVIQRNLARGLVESSGARHYTIFYITPLGSSPWTYWLVHLSNNYKARDVMMELHWQMANHFSHYLEPDLYGLGYQASSDPNATRQFDFDLGEAHHFDAVASQRTNNGLTQKLIPAIYDSGESRPFGQWLEAIGSSTPATAEMIRLALDPGIRSGDIIARSKDGAMRKGGGSLKPTDILSPSSQRSFILVPRS